MNDVAEMAAAMAELRADLRRVTNECDTVSALAGQLGTAIGWDTPGETWVDKARFLKAFYTDATAVTP